MSDETNMDTGHARRKPKYLWRPKTSQLSSRLQGRLTYEPPRLKELQQQNRAKARKYFPKRKPLPPTTPPERVHAPRNTSSYLMRVRSCGGVAPPTPTPSTPLTTPDLSSYPEGNMEEVNNEWGVDGYGSMSGLIRLRAFEDVRNDSDSESDVEQVESVQQLEERLDRFEIVYPPMEAGKNGSARNVSQLDEQESRIAQLEEENLTLKERIYILEQQLEELKQSVKQQRQAQQAGEANSDDMEVCSKSGERASDGQ